MITQIKAEGYRSLADTTLELKNLNVFIGPNGAGKSNLLDLLDLMRSGALGILSQGVQLRGGITSLRSAFAGLSPASPIRIAASFSQDREQAHLHYCFEMTQLGVQMIVSQEYVHLVTPGTGLFEGSYPERSARLSRQNDLVGLFNVQSQAPDAPITLQDPSELAISQVKQANQYRDSFGVWMALLFILVYEPMHLGRSSPPRFPRVPARDSFLLRDASNLAAVLSTRLADDQFQADFDHYVRLAFPDFKRVHFPPDPSGEGRVQLTWYNQNLNRGLSLSELSDGMIAYLSLLAILLNPAPGSIICIDEPEVGLHPRLLDILADLVRAAADDAQVLVSTHSAAFASFFAAEDIVIVEAPAGRSEFRRLSEADLREWLAEFSIGELMTMGKLESAP